MVAFYEKGHSTATKSYSEGYLVLQQSVNFTMTQSAPVTMRSFTYVKEVSGWGHGSSWRSHSSVQTPADLRLLQEADVSADQHTDKYLIHPHLKNTKICV